MDQVCKKLNIIEQDYFGLQYIGSRGEEFWLNLRNRVDRQVDSPYSLRFRVKYYVPPHALQEPRTKVQFYDQVKADLLCKRLVIESEDQLLRMLALIVQAEKGDFNQFTSQLNQYESLVGELVDSTPELILDIVEIHRQLQGTCRESAQYQVLQEASRQQTYGVHYYGATDGGDVTCLGIGPHGLFLYNQIRQIIEKLDYAMITKVETIGRTCVFKVMTDNGIEREMLFKLNSESLANAVYRCITEMHSFFKCDTVSKEVFSQFSRDFKGTLASLFNEKSTYGRDYVFDINRTEREAYDFVRRKLFTPGVVGLSSGPAGQETPERDGCDTLTAEQKCQMYEDTLGRIEESLTCCVCRVSELTGALDPCGHLTCYECGTKLTSCPLCRIDIKRVLRIFPPTLCNTMETASSISLKARSSPKHHAEIHTGKKRKKEELRDSVEGAEQ